MHPASMVIWSLDEETLRRRTGTPAVPMTCDSKEIVADPRDARRAPWASTSNRWDPIAVLNVHSIPRAISMPSKYHIASMTASLSVLRKTVTGSTRASGQLAFRIRSGSQMIDHRNGSGSVV